MEPARFLLILLYVYNKQNHCIQIYELIDRIVPFVAGYQQDINHNSPVYYEILQ